MKLNWGTKIAAIYTIFVLFTLVMVYKAFGEKYDLVTEDYYAEEIAYQTTINNKARANQLNTELKTALIDDKLQIIFPQKTAVINGKVVCFRPSDKSKDFEESISTNQGKHSIPLSKFFSGKYLLKVEWIVDDLSYYKEQTIIIP